MGIQATPPPPNTTSVNPVELQEKPQSPMNRAFVYTNSLDLHHNPVTSKIVRGTFEGAFRK